MNSPIELNEFEKKDVVYSLRMSSAIRKMLTVAARDQKRTVAALLNSIIMEYLHEHGYFNRQIPAREQRRAERKQINLPAFISQAGVAGKIEHFPCLVKDVSVNGILIHMPKNKRFRILFVGEIPVFKINFVIPEGNEMIQLDCSLRHIHESNNELHLGCSIEMEEEREEEMIKLVQNL